MLNTKQQLINVFQDTQEFYKENPVLAAAVAYGREHTRLYEAEDYPEIPALQAKAGRIQVVNSKTFETAVRLHKEFPDKKIAVLNFASAVNPGGGVKKGSSAQEESLCRCSTLFPTLDRRWLWEKYYGANRQRGDRRNSDTCIYSPGVIICKTDDSIPVRMEEKDFVTVDVVTCAAPDLRCEEVKWRNLETGRLIGMEAEKLYGLHVKRAKHILHIAAVNGADILVLGAFGCGAFQNDPDIVAKAYREALKDYQDKFDSIVFAIYCRVYETGNFDAFERELGSGC